MPDTAGPTTNGGAEHRVRGDEYARRVDRHGVATTPKDDTAK
jgi:hypothetical protein